MQDLWAQKLILVLTGHKQQAAPGEGKRGFEPRISMSRAQSTADPVKAVRFQAITVFSGFPGLNTVKYGIRATKGKIPKAEIRDV